ncbi:MAG: ABC transporter permease [Candidatus Omnitrophica bacterium]|nr:ABC transporter permease [Candidatus Omnitrophota bacterium]
MDDNVLIIEAGRTEKQYFRDLWRYRELFVFLAWRDILVRYKQTVFGVLWAIVRPLMTMVVFTIVFGKIAKMPSGGVPYPILVFTAMLPWQFFASSFSESSNSLIGNSNLLTKIYFPRMIMPASSIVVAFVDFLVAFVVLAGLMVYYGFTPGWTVLTLPVFILLAFMTAMGAGLFIAALNVKFRDFKHLVPFVVQFGLYISPVGFSTQIVPEKWQILYSLNPMVGVIDGFRWAILGQPLNVAAFFFSMAVAIGLMILGIWFFRMTEKTFADDI